MADPITVISAVTTVGKILKSINDYQSHARKIPRTLRQIQAELPVLLDALKQTQNAINNGYIRVEAKDALRLAILGFQDQITDLDTIIKRILPLESDSWATRSKKGILYLLEDDNVTQIRTNLQSHIQVLTYHAVATSSTVRSPQEPKAITFLPFERNNSLVNRRRIFKALDRLLAPPSRNRSVAIWGLGGCGKTQVALEYAYRRQEKTSCSIFWIHADSEARFTQDYNNLAKIARLSPDLKGEDLLSAVKQWIEHQEKWLLILDNADDLGIFKRTSSAPQEHQVQNPELLQFVPKSQTGTVIWTSRDGAIINSIVGVKQGVEVGAMNDGEALDLFQTLSGQDNSDPSENKKMLLELLQNLPLAIAQAATYIRKTKVSVQQYLTYFHESKSHQLSLLSQEFPDAYRTGVPNSVLRTWNISMEQIGKESLCSEKILRTIAFFDNKGLPFELIRRAAGPTFSEDEILLAASRLTEYSFLQQQRGVDEGLPTYEQHRLVQLATRQSLTKKQTSSFSGEALRILGDLFPNGRYRTWIQCSLYLPHALKVATYTEAIGYNNRGLQLLESIGRYHWEQGWSGDGERFDFKVLELRKEGLGPKHPKTIRAMANLASTWGQQGRYDEAEQLQVEALELYKEVLGPKHPDTIIAIGNLTSTWRQQGRYDEAEQLQVEALELYKEVLGPKHPDTIIAIANLASTWRQQDRYDEAEQLQVEALELCKEVLGPKHPDTIRAMVNLASTWWQQGRYDEAEQLQVEVLELGKEVLDAKHPDTIRAIENLATMRS